MALFFAWADARSAEAWQIVEPRYCGAPKRTADGDIYRDPAVTRAFQQHHRCPSTGQTSGACPGWAKDHVLPLACGGCDAVANMQWLDTNAKRIKDGYERRIGEAAVRMPDTPSCSFRLTPSLQLEPEK